MEAFYEVAYVLFCWFGITVMVAFGVLLYFSGMWLAEMIKANKWKI